MNAFLPPGQFAQPANSGELFVLTRNGARAHCVLRIHRSGWEIRLRVGDALLLSHVCRSHHEVSMTRKQWKTGMINNGWS
jgi:hypothetical protein